MIEFFGPLILLLAFLVFALFLVSRLIAGKWWPHVFFGVLAVWLILPSIILQVRCGYHVESGLSIGDSFWRGSWPIRYGPPYLERTVAPGVAKICGDDIPIDAQASYHAIMPEDDEVRRFWYYSKYGGVVWLGVGSRDRYCLARYYLAKRKGGGLSWFPDGIFPFPVFRWNGNSRLVEQRLIERIPPLPSTPDGVRRLLPGQCVAGEIQDGETLTFQIRMPYFRQEIYLSSDMECVDEREGSAAIQWQRDGRPLPGWNSRVEAGGLYEATVRAPAGGMRRYTLATFWGTGSECRNRNEWRGGCRCPDVKCKYSDSPPSDEERPGED